MAGWVDQQLCIPTASMDVLLAFCEENCVMKYRSLQPLTAVDCLLHFICKYKKLDGTDCAMCNRRLLHLPNSLLKGALVPVIMQISLGIAQPCLI